MKRHYFAEKSDDNYNYYSVKFVSEAETEKGLCDYARKCLRKKYPDAEIPQITLYDIYFGSRGEHGSNRPIALMERRPDFLR